MSSPRFVKNQGYVLVVNVFFVHGLFLFILLPQT